MASYIDSLKRQNSFLQSELERHANACDALASELDLANRQRDALQKQLDELRKDQAELPFDAQNSS
ncbi:hypothetical protein L905_19185 [Agrobacterium sp. TS43]|uniref:hypothetical protein n=1 Tax=Agrobacterium TaxID=357 RepID=UPI00049EA910|nr:MULTISPECIES: hypothetical protein [Agrobacterium]KDR87720.1 hypothetical protein K538_07155 [Agrobacterium tumefaciens GW4]KVK49516.1 hypothetical protein L903_19545 [Agrobacterium sp. JL28]KVK49753.1 hypothetical protein L904_19535 [Agrobacterium sp. LY4]KVK62694.1 hypothetical protein L906_18660 [Agrobacterium sp. TS45]KVK65079.1 hypothetical protein L905_19185 [Agrobacterium sp. TS43]